METCILSSVKQITSPGWMHETSAQGWCAGTTQRDGMGRQVGGGCVNVRQKPLQYCKVISLQLIKINGKKIKFREEIWTRDLNLGIVSVQMVFDGLEEVT